MDFRFPPIEIKFDEQLRSVLERNTNTENVRVPDRVQLLRVGTFHHAQFGEIKVTESMLHRMRDNFEKKVRGIDLAIDYKHDSEAEAAGWIRNLELHEGEKGLELWAVVDWTAKGEKKLHEKEFRYLSADFAMDYKDNESLISFGPTLFGAGLTNRPVVKNMQAAVALMETKETEMKKEEMSEELMEDKKEELQEEMKEDKKEEMAEELPEEKKEEEEPKEEEEKPDMEKMVEELKKKIEELEAENMKLKGEAQLSEKNSKFDVLLSEGKCVEAQRDAYIEGDLVKFSELAGSVNLKAKGNESKVQKDDRDLDTRIVELADKIKKEQNLNHVDAITKAVHQLTE